MRKTAFLHFINLKFKPFFWGKPPETATAGHRSSAPGPRWRTSIPRLSENWTPQSQNSSHACACVCADVLSKFSLMLDGLRKFGDVLIKAFNKVKQVFMTVCESSCLALLTYCFTVPRRTLEVGRYIQNIVNISPISIYRYRYCIGTLDVSLLDITISYR